jgi:hypothetical protein
MVSKESCGKQKKISLFVRFHFFFANHDEMKNESDRAERINAAMSIYHSRHHWIFDLIRAASKIETDWNLIISQKNSNPISFFVFFEL